MESHLLTRLFVSNRLSEGQLLDVNQDQAHYLTRVMRLTTGNFVRIFNGQDGEWLGSISTVTKRSLTINPTQQLRSQQQEPALWLYCAPIKKAHFEYMIEKATELGVAAIQPILTARTQIREVNSDRCHAIAVESAEQSERLTIPSIHAPLLLKNCLATGLPEFTPIVCAEWGDAQPVAQSFSALPRLTKTAIFVGPEGGVTEEEFALFRTLTSPQFIRLGSRILRADTAAISALSCWQALCGDWNYLQPT